MVTMKSQEATYWTFRYRYDVFLSFRGEDTRRTFTDHLYTALTHAGFKTFKDDSTKKGEDINSELQKAIEESKMSIIVLSKNYASSTWCLEELVMIMERRRTSGHVVLPVFYDVDPSEVRKQTGSFEKAFAKHERTLKSAKGETKEKQKDMIRRWRAALTEVTNVVGMNLQDQACGHEARFILEIVKEVGSRLRYAVFNSARASSLFSFMSYVFLCRKG